MRSPISRLQFGTFATSIALASGVAFADSSTKPLPATTAVPSVYVVPMKGQMGTDIRPEIYKEIVKDILKVKPDILIYEIDSADYDNIFYLRNDDMKESGMALFEEYRNLIRSLHFDLSEFSQVVWVDDSVGFSSLLALAWPDVYMKSDGRLGGLSRVSELARGWRDPDVGAKMMAAITGIGKGFLEQGGYPLEVADAMISPEALLSANFEGRKVKWTNDTSGVWIVDSNPKATANFSATTAEDSGLVDGLADSLDDLMFVLGYREFKELDSGTKIFESYCEDWRRALDRCKEWWLDANSTGGGDVKELGQQVRALDKIVDAMTRYPAIELRARQEGIPSKLELEVMIDQIKEAIRSAKSSGRTSGGSGRPGRGGGMSAPGGSLE